MWKWAGAALAIMALSTGQASAETRIRKSYSYFPISGRTAADLDRELERKGPHTNATGMRHPGATRIKFGGTINYLRSANRCAVGDVTVKLNVTIIMPRWKNRATATPELGFIWDTLASDIKRHEERHAEIAVQHARGLETTLKALKPEKSCEILQEQVAIATDKATDEHEADQVRFDRIEAVNFNARILRLLQYRAGKQAHR
ncbi:DUF922 domain-containing Zn-dependent protease [Rhizobium paknamense]|uniref:Secreted Zn-dependent protease n=1 Tax=Rhizobium paknamense TaxID=1206817 RepID=A0ABU0I7P2_9HYPH|nr:DUF922 domain-containing protein [Rhizobium paknamense]MDQ0453712.1 putative secreted Zn-dependent protease [Rhizobium paknamense]